MRRDLFPWTATGILLLAAWARLSRLTWYSLDVDEAFSLFWARVPLGQLVPDLLALRGDPHPPGYYALLKPWLWLLGENEPGLRLFSALAGLLFVALIWRLGRDLLGPTPALVAAALAAVSPGLVYASLDARMDLPAATFALAGAWALWRGLGLTAAGAPALARAIAFGTAFLFLTLACYSHLAGALFVAGLAPACLLWAWPSVRQNGGWRTAGPALLTLLGVAIAYLPYALNAWRVSAFAGGVITRSAPDIAEILTIAVGWTLTHNALPPAPLAVVAAVFVWVAVLLGGPVARRLTRWGGLIALLLVPLLLVVVLSQRQALLQPKILAVTTAGPLLLALSALTAERRPGWGAPVLSAAALLPLFGLSLWGYAELWRPEAQRDNWEAAAAYLEAHVGPRDVVLTHLHFYDKALAFYYDGPIVTPFGSRLVDDDEVARGLAPYLDHEVLWLAQSGHELTDPDSRLENWLMARYPVVTAQFPMHITLKGFLLAASGFPPLPGTRPLEVAFAGGGRLSGVWLDQRRLPADDIWLHPPSNWLHVVLYATPGDYRLTLEDGPGNVWGGQLPSPGIPVTGDPKTVIRHDVDLNLNPAMPAGPYKVVLRQIGPDGPMPRADNGETWLILEQVEVLP